MELRMWKGFLGTQVTADSSPSLGSPGFNKDFVSIVCTWETGVLTPKLRPLTWVIAYFSKQLDQTAKGWPPCLRVVATTVTLLEERENLIFGQPVAIWTSPQVQSLINSKGTEWLLPGRSIQAMLLNNPVVTIKTCHILNPTTLFPIELGDLEHNCIENTNATYLIWADLESESLPNMEEEWFAKLNRWKTSNYHPKWNDRSRGPAPWDHHSKGWVTSPH